MKFNFKKNRMGNKSFSQINVTPFVDVMLVLLIVFMITAPLLTVGVKVDLPKTKASQLNQKGDPLVISVKKNGSVYIQDRIIEISKIIPNDGNTVVKIRLRDQNNELDFTLKNKRNIDRKMLNIIRNKEISAIIR